MTTPSLNAVQAKTNEEYFWEYKRNYRGYIIQHKRDFGDGWHLIEGMPVRSGFVIVKDHALASPGATWSQTVADAMEMIDILIAIEGTGINFWTVHSKIRAAQEAATKFVLDQYTNPKPKQEWSDC